MVDHEPKHGDHSRHHDREKDHDIDEEREEVEILPKHLAKCWKEKKIQKVMEIILNEEKEK